MWLISTKPPHPAVMFLKATPIPGLGALVGGDGCPAVADVLRGTLRWLDPVRYVRINSSKSVEQVANTQYKSLTSSNVLFVFICRSLRRCQGGSYHCLSHLEGSIGGRCHPLYSALRRSYDPPTEHSRTCSEYTVGPMRRRFLYSRR